MTFMSKGARIVIHILDDHVVEYTIKFNFPITNNVTECKVIPELDKVKLFHIRRTNNTEADILVKLALTDISTRKVTIETKEKSSIEEPKVMEITNCFEAFKESLKNPIVQYIRDGHFLENKAETRTLFGEKSRPQPGTLRVRASTKSPTGTALKEEPTVFGF
ncbi:hypothetical protein ACLOJK_011859 [Asimina triloba]